MIRSRGLVLVIIVVAIASFAVVSRLLGGPTLQSTPDVQIVAPGDILSVRGGTPTPTTIATPTLPIVFDSQFPPQFQTGTVTAVSAGDLQAVIPTSTPIIDSTLVKNWNPPAISVPIAINPWDHYWFIRPVAAKYTNFGLTSYPYGANGAQDDLRIHHGIDLANPIGVEVLAAGDGTVVSAQKGHINQYESITAYGNCIVIDHDFGYNGEHLYTLYAHLSAILVQNGDHVRTGQVIGLIGNTGQVTGPHVHFEVRVGRDSYFSVRNPSLWMAPYLGTGIVAGRLAFPDHSTVDDVVITLIDRATGNIVDRITTYAGFGVNGDDNWKENFVFADVPAGRYLVTSVYDTLTWSGTVDVIPGATSWVDMVRFTAQAPTASPPVTP